MRVAEAKDIPIEQHIFNKGWEILKEYYYLDSTSTDTDITAMMDAGHSLVQIGKGTPAEKLGLQMAVAIEEHLLSLYDKRKE